MPLIRYVTDDSAELLENGLYHIEGHRTAAMIGRDGEHISPASFCDMDATFDILEKFQFVQYTPGIINANIVPKGDISSKEIEDIKNSLYKKFMGCMDIKVNIVDDIQLTARGKYALLIQHIKED